MTTRPTTTRHPKYVKSPFDAKHATVFDDLERELRHLKATEIIIETGHETSMIRNDGWPRGGSSPKHPDVRLYFTTPAHGTIRYECNRYDDWLSNLRAIGLWMQRQRISIEEWGIGAGGESYQGFRLPPGSGLAPASASTARDSARVIVMAAGCDATDERLDEVLGGRAGLDYWFRLAARKVHPDGGGTEQAMRAVNVARDALLRMDSLTGERA